MEISQYNAGVLACNIEKGDFRISRTEGSNISGANKKKKQRWLLHQTSTVAPWAREASFSKKIFLMPSQPKLYTYSQL